MLLYLFRAALQSRSRGPSAGPLAARRLAARRLATQRVANRAQLIDERLRERAVALNRRVPRHKTTRVRDRTSERQHLFCRKARRAPAPLLAEEAEHVDLRAIRL